MKHFLWVLTVMATMSHADVVLYGPIKGGNGVTFESTNNSVGEITQMEDYGRRIADMGFSKDATCRLEYRQTAKGKEIWLFGLTGDFGIWNDTYLPSATVPWEKWPAKVKPTEIATVNAHTNDCYDLHFWSGDKAKGRDYPILKKLR
ncbi:hypothetical protein LVJ82_08790 [Vitreoscilla massiliensis]|uniref:Beta/gamma crystallin 'Greek key' domain-containing protein n=1 Tax=Vitreoscilla massiliensis TaxID=1689272 RepID=A0ABY4E5J9_9NEIS|nr:hypothetical protein [Vitreoscilla massiliensis]UOO91045.1 hypothetical protein LVJ82_08790 [Vitreoscilla massiliensis]